MSTLLNLSKPISGLEFVHDQPSEPSTQMAVTKNTATDLPSSSTQALQTCTPIQTTNISSPPTMFLDSIILADVCESIFKELNKLVKARNNFVHEENYVKEWRRLRERVDFVMSELQKSSLEMHSNAQNTLNDWFKDVVKSMHEVEIKRTQEMSKRTSMFLSASGIISSNVHSENLDLKWLTKLKVQTDSPILEKLKNDSELEKENKRLKKELIEQRLLLVEYKRQTEVQLEEEARLREANHIISNNEFREEMKKQSETTNSLVRDLMDMIQKQANP